VTISSQWLAWMILLAGDLPFTPRLRKRNCSWGTQGKTSRFSLTQPVVEKDAMGLLICNFPAMSTGADLPVCFCSESFFPYVSGLTTFRMVLPICEQGLRDMGPPIRFCRRLKSRSLTSFGNSFALGMMSSLPCLVFNGRSDRCLWAMSLRIAASSCVCCILPTVSICCKNREIVLAVL